MELCECGQTRKRRYIADGITRQIELFQCGQPCERRYIAEGIAPQIEVCQAGQPCKRGYIADGIASQIEVCQCGQTTEITGFQCGDALIGKVKLGNCRKMCHSHIVSIIDPWHRGDNRITHLLCPFTERRINFIYIRHINGNGNNISAAIAIGNRDGDGIFILCFII